MKTPGTFLSLAGCLLLFLPLGWTYFQKPAEKSEGDLIVDSTQWVGDKMVGKTHEVVFVFDNPSTKAKRYLHSVYNCTPHGCVSSSQGDSGELIMAPGQKTEFRVQFSLRKAGPFKYVLPTYVEDGGIRTFDLTIKGEGVNAD